MKDEIIDKSIITVNQEENQDYQHNKINHANLLHKLITIFGKIFYIVIWIAIILIVLASIGKYVSASEIVDRKSNLGKESLNCTNINNSIKISLLNAKLETKDFANKKMDQWIKKLMLRVENDYLQWFFGYWNQLILGLSSIYYWLWHWFSPDNNLPAKQVIANKLQNEFTKRVIRPDIAELEIERITNEIMQHYTASIRLNLKQIFKKNQISQYEWQTHLDKIIVISTSSQTSRDVPLTLKTIALSTTGSSIAMGKAFSPVIKKIASNSAAKLAGKVSTNVSSKAGAAIAAKTGGKFAAKTFGKILGSSIGVLIIVWDVWDHFSSKKSRLPVVKNNVKDYLNELKEIIVNDPNMGLMSLVHNIEQNISYSIRKTSLN